MLKCLACGGMYDAVLADGMQYFHRCPPLSVAELVAAVAAGKVVLPKDPVTTLPETADVAVTRRVYERANLRDENVTGPPATPGDAAPIKAPGAGVVTVAAPAGPPVVVV